MTRQPTLRTRCLILRPFELTDAKDVQDLAGERAIAATTLNIPYPYEDGLAEEWISKHQSAFERGELANFAIIRIEEDILIGTVGLKINMPHERAELGYWIGLPYWGKGYCTQAAKAVLKYAFDDLGLNRVCAYHFRRNPASGRVMQKIGMIHEGTLRQHIKKWEIFEDEERYGILRKDFSG